MKEWFKEQRVPVEDWAPYSPDLNPIEHVWKALKELVAQMYPDVMKNISFTDEVREQLEEALKSAWNALPDILFESLLHSMPKRVKACMAAKGRHTKY